MRSILLSIQFMLLSASLLLCSSQELQTLDFERNVQLEQEEKLPPPCDNQIYCHGEILHTVQMALVYPDSKTFVDMKLRHAPNEITDNFNTFMTQNDNKPSLDAIRTFVEENFEEPGKEFEQWTPNDWKESPEFVQRINDSYYRDWAMGLNSLWKILGRKMHDNIKENRDRYSIIYVPNPVIVPGGRFREFYYWDSYWIIKGLLICEMYDTSRGMLENFLSIVEEYGFIPNGGRIYYAKRSQPPLLIPMMKTYLEYTKDFEFVKKHIHTLEKEMEHWINNHTISVDLKGNKHTLAIYGDKSSGPRPESYREDIQAANIFNSTVEKENFYSELKAAAESGWDFSSRWFILNGTNKGNLTNLRTRSIVPVDLNAVMYGNFKILTDFFIEMNDTVKSEKYNNLASQWKEAVTQVLWHDDVGAWLDYDLQNKKRREYFYPTNVAPLWTGCYDLTRKDYHTEKIIGYLYSHDILKNRGGVPTTLEHSGEQWDYPNAWAPVQYIMIMALHFTDNDHAQKVAFELAELWVRSNFRAYNETLNMFEKYDATVVGGYGTGGEYEVQVGFGWTNGVIMELLNKFGDRLLSEEMLIDAEPLISNYARSFLDPDTLAVTFGVGVVVFSILKGLFR